MRPLGLLHVRRATLACEMRRATRATAAGETARGAEVMSGDAQRFVEMAESFCRFMEEAGSLALPERLRRAQELLLALYREALDLPDVEPDDDVNVPDDVPRPEWPGMGEVDGYWEVFDPYKESAPVYASLSDDLLDVYGDVRGGLEIVRAHGERALPSAIWHWRFTFQTHWGDHAVDALRALHRAVLR